jgi:phosphoglycolate phosphatase-like HAD superfamily hydrolase
MYRIDYTSRCLTRARRILGRPAAARHCKPREAAVLTLKTIMNAGHRNVVISNTAPNDLRFFVDLVGITPYISDIYGIGSQPVTKANVIHDIASRMNPTNIVVIGDTEKDVDAGLQNRATTYLFITRNNHKETKAHHIITHLSMVLNEVGNIPVSKI